MRTTAPLFVAIVAASGFAAAVQAETVFQNFQDNGFFVPFTAVTPSSVRYGDSGWFGSGSDAPAGLESITLGLAVSGSTRAGSTDLTFTFNDGDPSHLVFGSGSTLYSTTVHAVPLPDTSEAGGPVFYSLTIPLPGVVTAGGFNNIGWSVGVANFDSDGAFGFQCSSAFGQSLGFYTNNASNFDGSAWHLFSFGGGPFGVANFVAEVRVPGPGSAALAACAGLAAVRRRRR